MYVSPTLIIALFLTISIIPIILPFLKKGLFTWYLTMGISLGFILQVVLDLRTLSGGGLFSSGGGAFTEAVEVLGFQPYALLEGGEVYRCFTSIFIHLTPLHFMMNVAFLLFFSLYLENRMGRNITIASFYVGGLVSEVFVILTSVYGIWGESIYTYGVGASGAIFGIAGVLLAYFPRERIKLPFLLLRELTVAQLVGIYFLLDLVAIVAGTTDNVGHVAHIGGLAGGIVLGEVLKRAGYRGKALIESERFIFRGEKGLKELITDKKGEEILRKIRASEEREVVLSWLEELGGHLRCPRCGEVGLRWDGRRYTCPSCGYRKGVEVERVREEVSPPL